MITLLSGIDPLYSQNDSLWSIESGITFSHFEQQVKSKIGTPSGQKLSDISEFGICLQVNRKIYKNFSGGVYIEYDIGKRTMAEFNSFDSSGIIHVSNSLGGNYSELWLGPYLRVNCKNAFLDLGYAAVGVRNDKSRNDIISSSGNNTGSFTVNPKVAWFVAAGAKAVLTNQLSLLVKVQYRIRYYNKKDGDPLMNNIEHGTQNISPFIGLNYLL